ncbi:MAG: ATP-binding cassette domain-containing protein, partial [Synechococcales bacterium]|nr:ATP-binding cassette domain-containing protein [Synechococcales bacterium]
AGDRPHRVESAMKRCSLLERRASLIRKLSKGFRQRVGIAQAIVHDPPVIILDEPTVGLDPRQIIEVRNLIKSLAGDHTIILSTHILPEVSMTCNRVTIINRGQVVAINTPEQMVAQLSGGGGYDLEVEGDVALLQTRLEQMPGVQSVVVQGGDRPSSRHHIQVTLQNTADIGPDLAALVIGSGLKLYEMRRNQASLETVFLELTTTEKPIASAELAAPEAEAGGEARKSDG